MKPAEPTSTKLLRLANLEQAISEARSICRHALREDYRGNEPATFDLARSILLVLGEMP